MPSRQSTRLKNAANEYAEMTPTERECLTIAEQARYEAMTRKWDLFCSSHHLWMSHRKSA